MNRNASKRLVLVTSLVLAVGISFWGWYEINHREGPSVELIDNSEHVIELMEKFKRPTDQIPEMSPDRLVDRLAWTPKLAELVFPSLRRRHMFEYHPILGCRRKGMWTAKHRFAEHPNGHYMVRTNSMGLRDREFSGPADLRIFMAGDSQTEGVCAVSDSFVNRLETSLDQRSENQKVDVINGALGGTNPWDYLLTWEAYGAEFAPDIFVAVFFGGNDLRGVMVQERIYRGRGLGDATGQASVVALLPKLPHGMGPVELQQVRFFIDCPDDKQVAVDTWTALAMEMKRQCEAAGVLFAPVYMPPPYAGQPVVYAAERELVSKLLPRVGAEIDFSDELADRWIAALDSHAVQTIDLREAFANADEAMFWKTDHHLNLYGQQVVADALEVALDPYIRAVLLK